ncbi:hypothetical protein DXG01_016568, partial [Tephrocybe rancida]
ERQEFAVYQKLLQICDGLENTLLDSPTAEEIQIASDLVQKGADSARADDTKSMKPAVIDWITPADGFLNPPLNRRYKISRGFNHEVTGGLLCPAGLDWNNPEYGSL